MKHKFKSMQTPLAWNVCIWAFAALFCLVGLQGCRDGTTSQKADVSIIGKYGEYTGTNLNIRWPALPGSKDGEHVTYKIPAEYLAERAYEKDDKGEISAVLIDFAMPDVTPWEPLPLPNGKPDVVDAWEKHEAKRVFVILRRDWGARTEYGDGPSLYPFGPRHHRDGTGYGLERYTETICYRPDEINHPIAQQWLKAKPADDLTAANCFLSRRESIYIAPPELWKADQGVEIVCRMTTCHAYFSAGSRGAYAMFNPEELSDWSARIAAARKLITGFVVRNDLPAQ